LAVPIKKIHPDDKNGNTTCNPEMIEKLNNYIIREGEENSSVWNDLRKLLDNE
jgi:hypothetical protein